jgi:FtsP/CotA-like multicopper oxidase with cupredoxin domain
MIALTRRQFLASTAAAGTASAWPSFLVPPAAHAGEPTILRVENRHIDVNGKPARVFAIRQPQGAHGLFTEAGRRFHVILENRIGEPTLVHWHGLTPPSDQDGVPDLSQPVLPPGQSYRYDFPLDRPGTFWMHSHFGLQEQALLAAPLIIRDPRESQDDVQDVVVMLHDFTFRDPAEILSGLRHGGHGVSQNALPSSPSGAMRHMQHMGHGQPAAGDHAGHGAPSSGEASPRTNTRKTPPAPDHAEHGGNSPAIPVHLHDVEYDAFLANDRTLADPDVVRVESRGRIRLRLINAAATTNFIVDLGAFDGQLIAVDGMPIRPVSGRRFDLAIAQRLDIRLDLPPGQGSYPVFAVREGDTQRTGLVLATKDAPVARLPDRASQAVDAASLVLERRSSAMTPLPKKAADRRYTLVLNEDPNYTWSFNSQPFGQHTAIAVRRGERVEITFEDRTSMSHPIHLHGHSFQVVAINGERFAGAMRDTVLVPARGRVTIAFDADNPGHWALHCHNLYHMASGMMTSVRYET